MARRLARRARLAGAMFVALLLCLWLGGAAGAAVRMDVFLGYDGIVPEASWFPVTFEIANDGPAFNALVELSPSQYDRGQSRTMRVELPTGTTKRFVMPVFSSGRYTYNWEARLLDERGKVRAEAQGLRARKLNPWAVPLMAAVTRTAPALPEGKSRQQDFQPLVARLLPNLFPDNPITLEGLDSLYLSSEKALELKVPQVNALLAWLQAGGHLVVGIEQTLHVTGNEWLRRLLPWDLTGMATLTNHAALQEWVAGDRGRDDAVLSWRSSPGLPQRRGPGRSAASVAETGNPYARLATPDAVFEPAPVQVAIGTPRDGKVLVGSAENPLVVTAARGRGQLTLLLFSPELEPFVSWKNRPYFWAKMVALPPELLGADQYNRYGGPSSDGIFGAMIDSQQVRKLPVGWLVLLLVGYLLVIGPVDYYWLKKINRQMLTWITFPAYVALFSVLIYFIGYKLRAGESEWNELHVVDVLPLPGAQADLRGRTFVSVYSPVNANFRLASELPFAALRGEYMGSFARQEGSQAKVEQRGNAFAAEISVPVWTSQLYVHDWWQRTDPPVKLSVKPAGENWEVEIENHLKRRLGPAKLVLEGQVLDAGDLPAEETKKLTLPRRGATLANFVQQYGQLFDNAVNQRQRAFGQNRRLIGDVPRGAMAASFVEHLGARSASGRPGLFVTPPGLELSAVAERGSAILLAWEAGAAPVKPINQFSPRRTRRDTLWRLAMNF